MEKTRKLVVLDDDPTGIQTVHDCLLITNWEEKEVRKAMLDDQPLFYILTNTRAMTQQEASDTVRNAMEAVVRVNKELHYQLYFIRRSDSCLRGHFPLETNVMKEVLTENGMDVWPTVPFCPAFLEAGRVTIDGVHYMKEGDKLIPVSETEFARDNVFAYHTSCLKDYIAEKGANPADYQIVNASSYDDLYHFSKQLFEETSSFDGAVVIRSSSSLPKAMSGIGNKPLLDRTSLKCQEGVGCFIVGSHVNKTTLQLKQLLATDGTQGVEVDVQRILCDEKTLKEHTLADILHIAQQGMTPVVYTSRKEIRLEDATQRQHLGQQVSDFLVDLVHDLPFTPSYLVAKGGITSHDILTKGLMVKCARVMGQVVPSVPCVMTERFPYIIFPGNVGGEESLKEVFLKLRK